MNATRFMFALLMMASAHSALADTKCVDQNAVAKVLSDWDHGQRAMDVPRLERVLAAEARVIGKRPDIVLDRSREEFIAEIVAGAEAEKMIKAYAHTRPKIECAAGQITIERRGCVVVRTDSSLFESAQTETVVARMEAGEIRFLKVLTVMDAVRENGREIFKQKDFVNLKACAEAIGKQF